MYRQLLPSAVMLLLLVAASALAGDGPSRSQRARLTPTQDAYMAALRWSDFEGAESFIDPETLRTRPLSDLQRERYRQLQVSSYRERGSSVAADGSVERRVEMGVINRNTLAERTLVLTERWRWDPQAKRWWQVEGLPDLWQGQ